MSLITPFEVLKYSTAGFDYPTRQFCELIPQIEQEFARDCLGQDFYDYLVSKLTPVPTGVLEYDKTLTYAIGDKVIRNGCMFVSLTAGNTTDPLSETGDWEAFARFTDAASNQFWKDYLRRLLALKVFMSSLLPTTWRAGNTGVVIAAGDSAGMRAGNKGEMADLKAGLLSEIERVTGNMLYWISKNGTDAGFPSEFVCNRMCATPGRRSRRWAWKT